VTAVTTAVLYLAVDCVDRCWQEFVGGL